MTTICVRGVPNGRIPRPISHDVRSRPSGLVSRQSRDAAAADARAVAVAGVVRVLAFEGDGQVGVAPRRPSARPC